MRMAFRWVHKKKTISNGNPYVTLYGQVYFRYQNAQLYKLDKLNHQLDQKQF